MIFHRPDRVDDWVLYQPTWDKAQTIDLKDFNDSKMKTVGYTGAMGGTPDDHIRVRGPIGTPGTVDGWSWYWFRQFGQGGGYAAEKPATDLEKSMVMMSIFDRLRETRNDSSNPDHKEEHIEMLRRGGRYLNMSNAIAAGKIVVLATSDEEAKVPLPFPLTVDGEKVPGSGIVFYQFALPLERIEQPAATQPASNPTTTATTQPAAHVSLESVTE